MDRNRLWLVGTVLLIVATVAIGWLLGISPKFAEARVANSELASVEAQNLAYEADLASLESQFAGIGDLKGDLASLRRAVPTEAALPDYLRELDRIGQAHSVILDAIQISDAQSYAPVVPVEPPVAAEEPAAEATEPGTVADASPQPSATDQTLNSRITANNFVAIPISLTVNGEYGNVLSFIKGVQEGARLTLVSAFSTTAGTDPSATAVTGNISGLVYVLLDSSGLVPAAPTLSE